MKTNPRSGKAAFTLIELMAVITIIVILAGLVVGGMGFVNERQAKEKARVQIALLSQGLEDYKLDNGTYPPTTNKSAPFTSPNGTNTSSILFKALYFDSDNDGTGPASDADQRIYISQLDPATSKQGWTTTTPPVSATTIITDPWGNQYCYRTEFPTPPASGTITPNAATQNPGFDLWSMGKNGKSNDTLSSVEARDDIRQ